VLLAAAPAFATPPSIASKQAEAQQVIGQIHELDASLGIVNERLNLANLKLARVQHEIRENSYELGVAQRNLRRSQRTIARRLVTLYTRGDTSTLEVILGARSLVEVLNRLDTENRVSSLDSEVIGQVRTFRSSVRRHARELRHDRAQAKRLVAWRASQQRSLQSQIVERQRLLSSLTLEIQRMIAEQQARELARARAMRARYMAQQAQLAQARQSQSAGSPAVAVATPTVGATAQTPEGATVVPSSSYSGAVGAAMSELGVPYVWGGSTPSGFDCSGLVAYAYSKMGVSLPHSSYAQWNSGVPVPADQLEPGDLVFFNGLGHVGMYIGNGQYVHAPHTGDVVRVASMSSHGGYVGARRIVG